MLVWFGGYWFSERKRSKSLAWATWERVDEAAKRYLCTRANGHKNGTRTVFYFRRPKGTMETVGHTRDEKFTFEEPLEGEAPERKVTAKAKSTPVTAKEVLATQGKIREKWVASIEKELDSFDPTMPSRRLVRT
eukprot:2782734-Amphidinium_carterae.1